MNKNELLSKIWEEKRGRIVITEPYQLGVKITVDECNFDYHHIVTGLLSLLMSDPEKAYEWAKYWGRTVVQAHPTKGLSFSYSILGSTEEKLGVFFSTEKKFNPQLLLNEQRNKGLFGISLNNSIDLTIEGGILQVERMIDELVWNYHLKKITECTNETRAYAKALEEIFFFGVKINFVREEDILNSWINNPQLPVRIYGNILDKGTIPPVIGSVDKFPGVLKKDPSVRAIAINIKEELKNIESIAIPEQLPLERFNYSIDKAPVCVAITVGKKPHLGHLFQFTFANLVNRVFGGGEKLYLNVNNMGSRIAGLLAALASDQDISVNEVIKKIIDEEITDIDLIDSCYRKREMKGEKYQNGIAILNHFPEELFENASKRMVESFKKFGICLSYIKDSENKKEVEEIYKASNGGIPENGFRFMRYQCNDNISMCVIQKNGCPTASAMRAAFVRKLADLNKGDKDVVFVDAGRDVFDAEKLLRASSEINLLQFEGIGFGYGMEIASGTNGFAMSVEEFYQLLQNDNNLDLNGKEDDASLLNKVLTFFVLSRNMTASSYRHKVDGKVQKIGISFFDYKDKESFVGDFFESYNEMEEFIRKTKQTKMILSAQQKTSGIIAKNQSKGCANLINVARKIVSCRDIGKIFPIPRRITLNESYVALRNWLLRFNNSVFDIEDFLVEFGLNEDRNSESLVNILERKEILLNEKIPRGIRRENFFKEEIIFISDLKRRGYSEPEIREFVFSYLKGDYCLVRKHCIFFDFIHMTNSLIGSLVALKENDKRCVYDAINCCIEKIGIFDSQIN